MNVDWLDWFFSAVVVRMRKFRLLQKPLRLWICLILPAHELKKVEMQSAFADAASFNGSNRPGNTSN